MGFFDRFRKKKRETVEPSGGRGASYGRYPESLTDTQRLLAAEQHFRILRDSLSIIQKTANPETFERRYALALREADILADLCRGQEMGEKAACLAEKLRREKEDLASAMLDRYHRKNSVP